MRPVFRKSLVVFALLFVFPPSALPAATRIALVGGGRNPRSEHVLVQAEALLAGDEGLELLDRQTIGRVLAEQKLVVAGLVDPAFAVRAGKLLHVDVFAVVESPQGKAAGLSLVAFDAATGIRLWDATLDGDSLDEQIVQAAEGVRQAVKKRLAGRSDVHTVSLVTVRNAELPRGMDGTVQAVGRLLERRIARTPQLALLERGRLQHVVGEQMLPAGKPLSPLLASLHLVELEVRGDQQQWETAVRLSRGDGRVLATLEAAAPAAQPWELSSAVYDKLLEALEAKPASGRLNRLREADRLSWEADLLRQHREFAQAAQAAEAAYALDPQNPRRLDALIYRLGDAAIELIDPGRQQSGGPPRQPPAPENLLQSLDLARHGLDLQRLRLQRMMADPSWPRTADRVDVVNFWIYLGKVTAAFDGQPPRARDAVLAYVDEYRRFELEETGAALRRSVTDSTSFRNYSSWASHPALLDIFDHFRLVREDWAHDAAALLRAWSDLAAEQGPSQQADLFRPCSYLCAKIRHRNRTVELSEEDARVLREAYNYVQRKDDPLLHANGALLTLSLDQRTRRLTDAELNAAVRELSVEMMSQLTRLLETDKPPQDPTGQLALGWTELLLDAHALLPWAERTPLNREMFDELAARGVYHDRLVETTSFGYTLQKQNQQLLKFLETARNLLEIHPQAMEASARRKELAHLAERSRALREELGLRPEKKAPWKSVRTLIDASGEQEDFGAIAGPAVKNRTALALGMSWSLEGAWVRLTLLEFDLDSTQQRRLGTYSIEELPAPRPYRPDQGDELTLYGVIERSTSRGSDFVRDAVVVGENYYAATMGRGILVFPLDGGGPPHQLDESRGLPASHVQALAFHDGWLYAWMGQPGSSAYFVRLRPDGGKCEMLASSRRTVRQTPFDDTRPVECDLLIADAPRKRLLFHLTANGSDDKLGLWEFKPTRQFRQVLKTPHALKSSTRPYVVEEDRLLIRDNDSIFDFQLDGDRRRRLYGHETKTPWMFSPITIFGNSLWVTSPFGRIDLANGQRESLPPLRDGVFQPGYFSRKTREDELLLADPAALWLIELN